MFLLNSPHILKVESDWQLEIQLNGGTLVLSADCITNQNVNLGETQRVNAVQSRRETKGECGSMGI